MHFKQCLCLCLENPMDRGTWWATVHRVAESDLTKVISHTHTHTRDLQASLFAFLFLPAVWVQRILVLSTLRSHTMSSLPPQIVNLMVENVSASHINVYFFRFWRSPSSLELIFTWQLYFHVTLIRLPQDIFLEVRLLSQGNTHFMVFIMVAYCSSKKVVPNDFLWQSRGLFISHTVTNIRCYCCCYFYVFTDTQYVITRGVNIREQMSARTGCRALECLSVLCTPLVSGLGGMKRVPGQLVEWRTQGLWVAALYYPVWRYHAA